MFIHLIGLLNVMIKRCIVLRWSNFNPMSIIGLHTWHWHYELTMQVPYSFDILWVGGRQLGNDWALIYLCAVLIFSGWGTWFCFQSGETKGSACSGETKGLAYSRETKELAWGRVRSKSSRWVCKLSPDTDYVYEPVLRCSHMITCWSDTCQRPDHINIHI